MLGEEGCDVGVARLEVDAADGDGHDLEPDASSAWRIVSNVSYLPVPAQQARLELAPGDDEWIFVLNVVCGSLRWHDPDQVVAVEAFAASSQPPSRGLASRSAYQWRPE